MPSLTVVPASVAQDAESLLVAYRRAQKLIENLETVHVPEQAIAQLEERQQLMITSSYS